METLAHLKRKKGKLIKQETEQKQYVFHRFKIYVNIKINFVNNFFY